LRSRDTDRNIGLPGPGIPAAPSVPLVYKAGVNTTVTSTLNAISAKLTTTALVTLDASVLIGRDSPVTVARDWLAQSGLG
jgi:glycine betaine/choline ABC-type transport system substrate-binding protein